MNYYEHHLGDYLRDTVHLSMLEDGAYRRLIDAYYIREVPLPAELRDVFRLVRAQSKQDREAVETVLREFFRLTDAGWVHHRCDREIARFQDKQRKAKASASARWEKRTEHTEGNADAHANASPDAMRTHSEGNAPRARPQTPDTRHHPSSKAAGGEAPQAPPRASRLPPGWTPGHDGMAFAAEQGLVNGRADAELAKFRDFWAAKPGKDGTKLDWPATWRNWVRREADRAQQQQQTAAARRADEPAWRRDQRERHEAFLGPAAAKRSGTATTIDMEPPDATPRLMG